MKQKWVIMFVASTIVGCGGGGGGGSDRFSGVWSGTVSLVEDSCGVVGADSQYVFFTHLVNQNEEDVVLDNGVLTFSGTRQSDNSFRVSTERARPSIIEGSSCTERIEWRYESIRRDTAEFVVRSSTVTCTKGGEVNECRFGFSGSAYRSGQGGGPIVFEDGSSGDPIPIEPGAGGPDATTSSSAAESSL